MCGEFLSVAGESYTRGDGFGFLEIVEVGLRFKREDRVGFGEGLEGLPVFYHTAGVDAHNTVIRRIVGNYVDRSGVDSVEGVKRF